MPGAVEPAVVNAGPLLALSYCGRLDLLPALHAPLLVPESVVAELAKHGQWPLGGGSASPAWLAVAPLVAPPPQAVVAALDPGEAAVIALALERGIRRVVIDETDGRAVYGRALSAWEVQRLSGW